MKRLSVLAVLALAVVLGSCAEKPTPVTPADPQMPPEIPEQVAVHLAGAYRSMDFNWFKSLLVQDGNLPEFRFYVGAAGCPFEFWGLDEELTLHQRMFAGGAGGTDPPPMRQILATLTQLTPFVERTDLYRSTQNPEGIDATLYKVADATYHSDLLFDLEGDLDFQINGEFLLVIVEDLQKDTGDTGKFSILEWHDLGDPNKPQPSAVEESAWASVKRFYGNQPRAKYCPATSPEGLIELLAEAYRNLDLELLRSLLANENDAPYLFITASTAQLPEAQWGFTEEVRLHQRMFDPANTLPGQTPVPVELWLTSVTITLTQETPFTERTDLYASAQNPAGLSPDRWKAMDAIYGTNVLFDLQGDIDYQINGRAAFVVIEDLHKELGEAGKFLLLQWNDLENMAKSAAVSEMTWTAFKALYN